MFALYLSTRLVTVIFIWLHVNLVNKLLADAVTSCMAGHKLVNNILIDAVTLMSIVTCSGIPIIKLRWSHCLLIFHDHEKWESSETILT